MTAPGADAKPCRALAIHIASLRSGFALGDRQDVRGPGAAEANRWRPSPLRFDRDIVVVRYRSPGAADASKSQSYRAHSQLYAVMLAFAQVACL